MKVQISMFLIAKTLSASMTLWRRYDVRKINADANLLRENQCKIMDNYFNILGTISARFRLKSGKICKNNDHACLFHCITLAGSLGRCLNTQPKGLVFKKLPRDPANVNA